MTLRKAAREAGVSRDRAARISDYDFRHGRTTHLVEKTGNILGAGYLVGHKHATTTNTYLHARSSMAKSVLAMVAGDSTEGPQRAELTGGHWSTVVMTLSSAADESSGSRLPSQYRRTPRIGNRIATRFRATTRRHISARNRT